MTAPTVHPAHQPRDLWSGSPVSGWPASSSPGSGPAAAGSSPVSGPAAAGGWPDVVGVPGGRVRAIAARLLLRRIAARLPIRVQTPDGAWFGGGDSGSPLLRIWQPDPFFRRIGAGVTGLAESYMAGEWDSPDLVGLLTACAEQLGTLVPAPLRRLRRWYAARSPAAEESTLAGSRANIQRHYDLSDDLFALFLDPTMTYSSALFAARDTLAAAQRRKNQALLDLTGVGPGSTVLEIGTGWGELAIQAAARGARVTTLTISPAQYAAARARIAAAGLTGLVDVQLRDYRQATGRYDIILSVEMVEAVGEQYWPTYFATLDALLAPGGRVGLQAITMPHDRMLATRKGHTWIHKYIFPGGQIPSLDAIRGTLGEHTGLRISADVPMGQHYARTLHEWRTRFLAAADDVTRLGFDAIFQRMWNLYLAYSEAGFRSGYLDVHQLLLQRPT